MPFNIKANLGNVPNKSYWKSVTGSPEDHFKLFTPRQVFLPLVGINRG